MKKTQKKSQRRLTLTRQRIKIQKMNHKAIKTLRERLCLTWQAAADMAGWSVQRWGDVESGRHPDPRLSTVLTVAAVLGCDVDDLLKK